MMATTLPMHIITTEILPKVPAKSLLRFKCVCKSWKILISTTAFIHLQLQQSLASDTDRRIVLSTVGGIFSQPFDHNLAFMFTPSSQYHADKSGIFSLVGFCNGLVCVCFSPTVIQSYSYCLNVLNPSTGERCFQWRHPRYADLNVLYFGFGLGGDATDDYKVVVVVEFPDYCPVKKRGVSVCSLKVGVWKPELVVVREDWMRGNRSGVLINNHLVHWMFWNESKKEHRIGCFDLRNEQWGNDVPLPVYATEYGGGVSNTHFADILFDYYRDNKMNDVVDLGVLDDCLCLLTQHPTVNVWVMREYGVKASWVKLWSFGNADVTRSLKICPLGYAKGSTREILIRKGDESKLLWYNIEDKTWKSTEIHGVVEGFGFVCVCKGSLVPVPELDEELA